MNRSLWWPVVISASALLAAIVTLAGGILRPVLIFWFLLICPGMAVVRLLRINNFLSELTLAVALSIAMSTVLAETMVLARIWSSQGGLLVLISVSMVGVAFQVIEGTRGAVDVERTKC